MLGLLLILTGAFSGALGALVGIGGGMVLVPALVLGFDVPLSEAVPASLMCVVASSCAAGASYLEGRLADVRLAMTLELATVAGAILGGLVAGFVPAAGIALVFGSFSLYVALQLVLARAPAAATENDADYVPIRYPLGISGSLVAGGLSALLGVGGGPLKVPLMNLGMKVPFRVASATSNLMIGVTGAASVAAYAWRGDLNMTLVTPLVVGVLVGAAVGSKLMLKTPIRQLKRILGGVLIAVAVQMLWKGGEGLWPNH